jgi:hypothetical protein
MQKHWSVFKVLVQRLDDFRTEYIWKSGSFGGMSYSARRYGELNALCRMQARGVQTVAFLTSFGSAQWLLLKMRDS